MYHKIHFKNIYLLCYHFILLALNFNVVVRILSLLWLPVKMCWFSQVIQLSRAIRTFIRTTLWRRGNCYCIGSLTIKTPPCTESNGTALGSETPKPLILQWKHTRGRLSQQQPPWKYVGHHQSSPSPLHRFPVIYCDKKGSQSQRITYWGVYPPQPILQTGYRDWVCSP